MEKPAPEGGGLLPNELLLIMEAAFAVDGEGPGNGDDTGCVHGEFLSGVRLGIA
jgi:hypothetical protein